jgi:hypothetical protein
MKVRARLFALLLGPVAIPAPVAAAAVDSALLARALPAALQRDRHPRLFVLPEDLATGRHNARATPWGREYLARQKSAAARFVALEAPALRALVPKPGSLFVYGLGLNLDPVHQRRLVWGGWQDPFGVRATDGTRYPNAAWPDTGAGVVNPRTRERHYFVALAHGHLMQALEQTVLPALADVATLEGSVPHARAAAALLDAIAAVYPTNRRGPLDYPTSPADRDRGGRLDRPYYQAARGLANYGFAIDLIAATGELDRPSAYGAFPIREHVARNLLWDGGTYCHGFAVRGHQLHNGHADYLRGAAIAGILLDVPALTAPLTAGPLSLPAMLDVNIDRNGFYYETSPGYAAHNRALYVDLAEMCVAMRRLGWSAVPDPYAHPNLRLYLTAPFDRQEIGGHVPAIGDAGPDKGVLDPTRRRPGRPAALSDSFIAAQLEAAWLQVVRGNEADRTAAARLLATAHAGDASPPAPLARRWEIYHLTPEAVARIAGARTPAASPEPESALYGAKGLALLRGGTGRQRYGAQLFFGPGHNHSQRESLTWTFFSRGAEWSYDPGYFNKHYRMSWTTQTVSHLALLVDGRSHPWENGTGRLLAWQTDPAVQWALAAHPDLYTEQGVTRFERLIAQVHNPASGEPAYWLDVGRVADGQTRDDSFHTQMTELEASVPLPAPDPRRPALHGERDLGAAILASHHLAGFDAKNFYLVAPGEGYGFLGSPREVPLDRPVRLELSRPLFATSLPAARLVVDYAGAPGRRLIVAQGGAPFGVRRVPYVLQRDTGRGTSVFAKILRVVDTPENDAVRTLTAVPLTGAAAVEAAAALLVTWRDGRRDLWILGEEAGPELHVRAPGLPAVTTDAQVAFIQFDAASRARLVRASGAGLVRVEGGPELRSTRAARGRVIAVEPDRARVRVRWEATGAIQAGAAAVTTPPFGASATWEVRAVHDDIVEFADATLALARTEIRPVIGKPGVFAFAAGISRFYSGGSRPNTRYALGKAVFAGGTFVGRVRGIEGGRELHVTLDGPGSEAITDPAPVQILETAPGDTVTVVLNLAWSAAPP